MRHYGLIIAAASFVGPSPSGGVRSGDEPVRRTRTLDATGILRSAKTPAMR
jgi:hypothetical protein